MQVCICGMVVGLDDKNKTFCKRRIKTKTEPKTKTKIPQHPDRVKVEMKEYIFPAFMRDNNAKVPIHRSLTDFKLLSSNQNLLAQQRTVSCHLESPTSIGDEKRKFIADSFMGKSLSSLPELYRSAVLYNEAEHDHKTASEFYTITKEVFTDLNFILLSGNILLFCFGFSVLYTHIASYAASIGLNITSRNTVFSALGISNILGRVLLGVIGEYLFQLSSFLPNHLGIHYLGKTVLMWPFSKITVTTLKAMDLALPVLSIVHTKLHPGYGLAHV